MMDIRPQFRLRAGHDDLIIRWLLSCSPRQRSKAIRQALTNYVLDQNRPAEESCRDENTKLAAALDTLF